MIEQSPQVSPQASKEGERSLQELIVDVTPEQIGNLSVVNDNLKKDIFTSSDILDRSGPRKIVSPLYRNEVEKAHRIAVEGSGVYDDFTSSLKGTNATREARIAPLYIERRQAGFAFGETELANEIAVPILKDLVRTLFPLISKQGPKTREENQAMRIKISRAIRRGAAIVFKPTE